MQRWARDIRHFVEPWLRRCAERALGVPIALAPASQRHPTDREWHARDRQGRPSALVPALGVVVTMAVVFGPVTALYLAAHYQVIAWRFALALLGPTLAITCVAWLFPGAKRPS